MFTDERELQDLAKDAVERAFSQAEAIFGRHSSEKGANCAPIYAFSPSIFTFPSTYNADARKYQSNTLDPHFFRRFCTG